jgi:hypothetical protein
MSEALHVTNHNADEIRALVKAELEQAQVAFRVRYVGEATREKWQCDAWRVKIGAFETDYFTGLGHRKAPAFPSPETLAHEQYLKTFKPQTPAAADVLHSLLLDAEAVNESFADWCGDLGYDSDSIKALNTYQACCEIGQQLRRILPTKLRERLSELLRDY